MSIRQNGKIIAGATQYHPDLFDHKWADHQLDDVQWLRADTFSWQSGAVYESAYQHLVDDIDGKTAQTETISGITISFYLANDGHKITTDESAVAQIYAATGVAWYYVIDTTNQRFKLPRTKYGFNGLRSNVGDYVEAGLPNITGSADFSYGTLWPTTFTGALYNDTGNAGVRARGEGGSSPNAIKIDASLSSAIYGNSTTVQPAATQMYLYFYVGSFTQTALENTAGLNAELFNGKADVSTVAHVVTEFQEPTSANNYTWYRKYADGWVEQGGCATTNSSNPCQVSLPIEMANTAYNINILGRTQTDGYSNATWQVMVVRTTNSPTTTTGFYGQASISGYNLFFYWEVRGIAAN